MSRILIVDDDAMVLSFVEKGLRAHGHTVVVDDGARAARLIERHRFDLLILDIDLAGRDGLDLLRDVRARGEQIAVIVLSGHPELHGAAECLDVGADDYVTKPFRFDELLARVRARLRPSSVVDRPVLVVAGVRLDIWACRATIGDRVADLTSRELAVLEFLMRHPGRAFSKAEIFKRVWGRSIDPGSNVVNVHISSLRRKLGTNVIESVRCVGYRFRDR